LRTTFLVQQGQPVQHIASSEHATQLVVTVLDLSLLPPVVREQQAHALLGQQAQRPFQLSQELPLRASLLRLGVEEHLLLLTMHHIAFDGWSAGVFYRELSACYHAYTSGVAATLAPLPIQYADYTLWQRQWFQGAIRERQLDYWRQQLRGLAPLELPTDHVRPPVQTFCGAQQRMMLPLTLLQQMKELSRREGTTPFMTLLTAFQVLLARYSGQEDIVVGTPIANRTQAELESLVGFFVNTLVLRSDLSGNPSFAQLLQKVRKVCLDAYVHQDLPFEKLVEMLQPERDLSRSPLFQVMFQFQPLESNLPLLPGLTVRRFTHSGTTTKFDLSLALVEAEQGLSCVLEYSTDLFEASTVQRVLEHWNILLQKIVAHPEQHLSSLSLLTEAEWRQQVVLWNATEVASTQQTSLPHLFLFQAQQTPDAVAVTFEDSSLTYATLQHCASHLALILRQRGVSTETPVGLFMERSPELVMCVLAILLAGGAYVPLDPGYPRERLDFMIKQAQVALVLTRQCYLGSLSHFTSSWLDLDAGWPQLLAPASQPLPGPTALDQLAYILFTSGSTGQPKGVLASHRGTLNRLAWMAQTYPFQPGERCCQKTSLNFVDAVCELFAPLLSGYTVTIFSDDVVHNPELLLDRLAEEGIGRIVLVPSLLRLLLEAEGRLSERVPALQLWVCSGEVLPEELCRRFSVHLPDACLLNLYGSSEVAADASSYHVTMQERLRGNAPLGRPIANTRIYVLDRWGCPVPVGVSGEVYVGGRGLARGYAGHADWTAERFVPDPYSQEAGARLYRTGDLARYLPTGDLEYLGRLDQQVKLRGLRIESGEIETALSSHPAVRVAVVLLREDTPGDQRLVAYTVLHPDQTPTLEQIRQYLREKLPEYMLPSALVILDRLPLTPNGKLDRSALPVPGGRRSLKERYILPRTPIEASLVELWKDVLKVEQVGVHDNFFELGGSSLLSMHMLAGARRKGMQLEIQHLFQYQTIAQLAAFTFFAETSGQSVHVNEALVGLQTAGSKPPFVCVHPAGGEVIGYADLAYCLGPNQPFYGLRALGLDGKREPLRSIEEMAAFYIDELHTLASPGPYTLGGWSFGGLVAFEMALQLHQRGEEVALLVLLDAVTPSQMQRLPVPDTALLVREYAETLVKRSGGSLDESQCPPLLSEDDLRALDRDAQLRYLVKIAEAVGSDLLPFEKELLWKYLRVARSNSLAARRYQPRGRYSGRAVLFQVEKRESLEGSVEAKSDWEALVSGSLAVHTVPGTHQSFVHMPHVQFLAEYLTRYLP
ncbi:MAG TPA: amino acid adenylation domain-containing protein, partial [Ktedonobacteraceae bacterium]|nr:amino acid adenylation domain-containing protein [Ktedonobacteraceae bacterium]